jgi:hypothetical protein
LRLICVLGKRAGSDKKLYKNLEEQYQVQLSKSPEAFEDGAVSPFGPLTESSSRKTLINLISILNATFPDYDFSNASSEQFRKESNHYMVINSINTMLNNAISNYYAELSNKLWTAIDSEIRIKECDIYSYFPDCDSDPYAEDAKIPMYVTIYKMIFTVYFRWSFHYFLYNRKLRRIVYFTCRAASKMDQIHHVETPLSDDDEEYAYKV